MIIPFEPCSKRCKKCKKLFHITKKVDKIKCPYCGELHKVIYEANTKLSRIVKE
jgi:DNA-directed RNA polymerase subunit RPC12/RpoP